MENKDIQKSGLKIFSLKLPVNFETFRNSAGFLINQLK